MKLNVNYRVKTQALDKKERVRRLNASFLLFTQ